MAGYAEVQNVAIAASHGRSCAKGSPARAPRGGMVTSLQKNPNVALLYRDSNTRSTLSIQGVAHVDEDLIVFRFWCIGRPDAGVLGGADAIEPFQVNVVLHGDYLLTVHRRRFDLPGEVTEGRIPPGRSERYVAFMAHFLRVGNRAHVRVHGRGIVVPLVA